jgi:hypothetical protein
LPVVFGSDCDIALDLGRIGRMIGSIPLGAVEEEDR